MKKIMMLVAIGAIAAFQSNADYMRWMVSSSAVNSAQADENITGGNATMARAGIQNYAYAVLVASSTDQHNPFWNSLALSAQGNNQIEVLGNYYGDKGPAQLLAKSVVADGAMTVLADIGNDYASKYFFIELFDANGKLVGYSDPLAGNSSDIANFKSTVQQSADWSTTSAWGGGSFTAVPEPTGGLMILLGAGLIGLRRKKFI